MRGGQWVRCTGVLTDCMRVRILQLTHASEELLHPDGEIDDSSI